MKGKKIYRYHEYGRVREEISMKPYLKGSTDYAKTIKLPFRVGDLDLPERRYTRSREKEKDAQTRPCDKAK